MTITIHGRYPQFLDQTQWIVDSQARLNIAFVSHIGDIVQNGLNAGSTLEWDRMEAGLDVLHGVIPYAVCIGNHDYNSDESPDLQRDEIPKFLSNWSIAPGVADVVEIATGLSVIRVDSKHAQDAAGAAEVRAAIERAKGPFRVLALHVPIALPEGPRPPRRFVADITALRDVVANTREPVQLVMSGHEHNLQAILLDLGRPSLHVIAGGGSNARRVVPPAPVFRGRKFAMPATGFARVDLLGHGAEQGLLVSIFNMPRHPFVFWRPPRLVSQWWVEASGEARRVYPPNNPASASDSDSTG